MPIYVQALDSFFIFPEKVPQGAMTMIAGVESWENFG